MSCQGTVKFFNEEKGFGFITPHSGGEDLFVHCTGVIGNNVQEGDQVCYDEQYDEVKGKTRAANVTGGTGMGFGGGKGKGKGFGGGKGYGGGGYGGGYNNYGGGW